MTTADPVGAAAFEDKYRRSPDPWRFAASPYELRRYASTLEALAKPRYQRAFEPACSVGVLTARLAARCDEVRACDISPTAVRRARRRCARLPAVHIYCADAARHPPPGRFDLIVFSELGYYFEPAPLERLLRALAAKLDRGGEFMAVHWLGHSRDHLLNGDEVHALLPQALSRSFRLRRSERHTHFRLDSWVRR